ncbi:MAG: helix-turn-helix transcriptional regulator [Archaeoglobi archaeon]|nr:helix-turn-helix transcriptional regulator [Candidatus Mnemosynella sp.]
MLEEKARILKALGHPMRLKIVEFLGSGERCVCEIVPHLNADQPLVSQHLSILRNAGIVDSERRGNKIFYRLSDRRILEILRILDETGERRA